MIEELWQGILELTAQLVIPDWGAVVALIPVGLAAIVVVWLLMTVRRFATAGPRRRRPARVAPVPPTGTHEGAPSFAPIFGALGVFLVLLGLVFGPLYFGLGVLAFVLTLLYWGRESLAEYDHVEPSNEVLPAVVHVPPPGIHVPGPSFRPILGALAVFGLLFGLVFGGWVLGVGAIFLIVTLLGWLRDARGEYTKTLEADETGHLESLPAPGYPVRVLGIFLVVAALAGAVDAGLLPPRSTAGGEPGASPPPPPSCDMPDDPDADLVVHAENVTFCEKAITAPAGQPFTIGFVNADAGIPHNVAIRRGGDEAFKGDIFPGVATQVYDVPALEAGDYTFVCTVHPTMTGSLTVE